MDWFIDEYGYEWNVGEEMVIWFFHPEDGWFIYNIYDTTYATSLDLHFKIVQLDSIAINMGCTEMDFSFREFLF